MALACKDGHVQILGIDGEPLQEPLQHVLPDAKGFRPVVRTAISPTGRLLASVGRDGRLVLWEGRAGRFTKRTSWMAHDGDVYQVRFDAIGKRLVTSGSDKSVTVWSLEGEVLHRFEAVGLCRDVAFLPGERVLATSIGSQMSAQLWYLDRDRLLEEARKGIRWALSPEQKERFCQLLAPLPGASESR